MSNIGKWMYNIGDRDIWTGEEFDTKEQAIIEAKKEIEETPWDIAYFTVGQIEKVETCGIDIDTLLEGIAEETIADFSEVGEDYLCDVTDKDKAELEEKLNEVFFKWIKKNKYEPNFFKIENITKVML